MKGGQVVALSLLSFAVIWFHVHVEAQRPPDSKLQSLYYDTIAEAFFFPFQINRSSPCAQLHRGGSGAQATAMHSTTQGGRSKVAPCVVAAVFYVTTDGMRQRGWDTVYIESNRHFEAHFPASLAWYASGYIEGYTTRQQLFNMFTNLYPSHMPPGPSVGNFTQQWNPAMLDWVRYQWAYLRNHTNHTTMPKPKPRTTTTTTSGAAPKGWSRNHATSSTYWNQVGKHLHQLDGLVDGYNLQFHIKQDTDTDADAAVDADASRSSRPSPTSTTATTMQPLSFDEVLAISMWFEMYDILDATSAWGLMSSEGGGGAGERGRKGGAKNGGGETRRSSPHWHSRHPERRAHCSALIKVAQDDLYMAHDTWTPYNNMLRQYKTYNFSSRTMSFSSYPGTLHSGDDWYLLSNGLTVQETSNDNFNASSYLLIRNESVPEFIRVMTANFLAEDARSWGQLFCRENSGTYNNQYMVVDHRKFHPAGTNTTKSERVMANAVLSSLKKNLKQEAPGQVTEKHTPRLDPEAFFVVEQMPDVCINEDKTSVLRDRGYWASYNIPALKEVFDVSGEWALEQEYGSFFNHHKYSRAEIFRRNQSSVSSLEDLKALMRFNDFRHDPFSLIPNCSGTPKGKCDPPYDASLTIASRMDLNPINASPTTLGPLWNYFTHDYMGAIDGKIMAWSEFLGPNRSILCSTANGTTTTAPDTCSQPCLHGHFISGPTVLPQYDIPPFNWTSSVWDKTISHQGMPNYWNFPWIDTFEAFGLN